MTLVAMNAIKALTRVLNERRREHKRPIPAWLVRMERRLDEGDILPPDDLARIREYLERSVPAPSR